MAPEKDQALVNEDDPQGAAICNRRPNPSERSEALFTLLERLPSHRPTYLALLAFLGLIFALGNFPWHLDNYDQAKQAYVAYEIDRTGEFFFQTTPQGRSASKPPLYGWCSAALHGAGVPWDLAHRLPSLACAVAMLAILVSTGRALFGQSGAFLAAAAFGLNLLTPRLATLVRTDMMLAFFIFLIGWMIYRKVTDGTPWTTRERWIVFAAMLAALFTKGPVLYVFLLPGMIAFAFLAQPRDRRHLVWSGWWTWAIPLAFFLAWGVTGLFTNEAFYEDVVVRELFSRFEEGARDDERPQPLWFYLPHVLHKFAPWSVVLLAAPFLVPAVRRRVRENPGTLWLTLWAVGGLIVMTIIPAKRVDRIYPIIPPLALLVVDFAAATWHDRRARVAAGALSVAAFLFSGGYFLGLIPWGYANDTPGLVEFAENARRTAADRGIDDITILRARDESLLLYLDTLRFTEKGAAFDQWRTGNPTALLMSDRTYRNNFVPEFGPLTPTLDSGALFRKNERRYYLFIRPQIKQKDAD